MLWTTRSFKLNFHFSVKHKNYYIFFNQLYNSTKKCVKNIFLIDIKNWRYDRYDSYSILHVPPGEDKYIFKFNRKKLYDGIILRIQPIKPIRFVALTRIHLDVLGARFGVRLTGERCNLLIIQCPMYRNDRDFYCLSLMHFFPLSLFLTVCKMHWRATRKWLARFCKSKQGRSILSFPLILFQSNNLLCLVKLFKFPRPPPL